MALKVHGMSLRAYWFSQLFIDLAILYPISVLALFNMWLFGIDIGNFWLLLVLYPTAIVPFTYLFSLCFDNSLTATNVHIFMQIMIGCMLAPGIFLLRLLRETAQIGDILGQILTGIPYFSLSDGLIYDIQREKLNQTRQLSEIDLYRAQLMEVDLAQAANVTLDAFDFKNMGKNYISQLIWLPFVILILFLVEEKIVQKFWTR